MCFRSCRKFKNFNFLTFCSQGMHKFYCIFVLFMQFPVFDFGLVHFTSRPFICPLQEKGWSCTGEATLSVKEAHSETCKCSNVEGRRHLLTVCHKLCCVVTSIQI